MRTKFSLSTPSRRGAARLSAAWVIVAVVIALLMAAFAFVAQDETSVARKELATAKEEAKLAIEKRDALLVKERVLNATAGFTDNPLTTMSDAAAMKGGLEQIKAALPGMDGVGTYEEAITPIIAAYQQKVQIIADRDVRITELESQIKSERDARSLTASDKDKIIEQQTQAIADLTEQKEAEVARLESANEDQAAEIRKLNETGVELSDARRNAEIERDQTSVASTTSDSILRDQMNDIRKRSDKADGEISAADARFGIGYVNLAASDRLSEGTVFRIVSSTPGADTTKAKGYAVVTDVGPIVSEVRIYDVADPIGQPIIPGDQIFNPLYEPKSQRNAVLAGTIGGIYNEEELRTLFAEIGINVQDKITNTTDYLITGGPLFVDEDGEALEEPQQVENTPIYAEAVDSGVLVIPMRDVTQYFRR